MVDEAGWTADELDRLGRAQELEVAAERRDGTHRPWTPIWLVVADGHVYVRTWVRRDTGWYGAAVASGRARVRVPGLTADVVVVDVGARAPEGVTAAYRAKYSGTGADSVVTPSAVDSTLRLDPRR
ncbi:DUF2255 family protein [Cellulomonas sp. GbtcB1]|uniref:DUF2255 family protein n=1 Tax=Cellulomonas sp. GbtcB1 TaxID=2824746 RepID=UPI001C30C086|nr:DUF2255 family protein [Cellulomonas sp. GbtcB1]